MKIDNRIKIEVAVQFKDLAVGDMYEDEEGCFCIKTGEEVEEGSPFGRCLYCDGGEWREVTEHKGAYVKPLEATITIHGYKMEARN